MRDRARRREQGKQGAKSVLNLKGGYFSPMSRQLVVVDKPALKMMARKNERGCRR